MTVGQLESLVSGSLERCAGRVERAASGIWSFALENGRRLPASALVREGWAELRVPLAEPIDRDLPWSLLQTNGTLSGIARFVRHDDRRMGLHAEVSIENSELASSRIAAAYRSLRSAEAIRMNEMGARTEEKPEEGDPASEPAWDRLAEECGWRLTRREDGQLGVELDAPGLMNQAFFELRRGDWLVSIELLRSAGLAPHSRRAIALFLLALTGRLRLARGAVRSDPESVRLEVALPSGPPATAPELDLALEALSLACRLGSREVRALGHEPLARTYLAHTTED